MEDIVKIENLMINQAQAPIPRDAGMLLTRDRAPVPADHQEAGDAQLRRDHGVQGGQGVGQGGVRPEADEFELKRQKIIFVKKFMYIILSNTVISNTIYHFHR